MTKCEFFGEEASLHHVGLAVRSIREANPACEVAVEATQGVSFAFLELNGITLELLAPYGDRSPIARSVNDGVKLLHLCYEVPDLEAAIEHCRPAGFHRLRAPVPAPAFENRRIAWVFSRIYGLFELLERNRAPAADGAGSG